MEVELTAMQPATTHLGAHPTQGVAFFSIQWQYPQTIAPPFITQHLHLKLGTWVSQTPKQAPHGWQPPPARQRLPSGSPQQQKPNSYTIFISFVKALL